MELYTSLVVGKKNGNTYTQTYGKDEFTDRNDVVYTQSIPFYLKTKEFKNGVLKNKKSLSELWFNYDLDGTVNIRITTDDNRRKELKDALPIGTNKTECVLIPNDIQNANSYTFEFYGEGDMTIYAMERVDRTHTR